MGDACARCCLFSVELVQQNLLVYYPPGLGSRQLVSALCHNASQVYGPAGSMASQTQTCVPHAKDFCNICYQYTTIVSAQRTVHGTLRPVSEPD